MSGFEVGQAVEFNGRAYTVDTVYRAEQFPETLRQMGIVWQLVITGKRGAARLLQIFDNGQRRTIDAKGRSEVERISC